MTKLIDWINDFRDGEDVEAVAFGEMGWGTYNSEQVPNYGNMPRNTVLTLEEARPWLDYEFSDGYGAPRCQAMVVWTVSWIISVYQYDGSTSPFRIARNPRDGFTPEMPGN